MFGNSDWSQITRRLFGAGGPNIRPMRSSDVSEVLRVIGLHDTDDAKAARISFERTGFREPFEVAAHFVLEHPTERRPLGVIGYYVDDLEARGTYWLGWTYVNPFERGKGHGGHLMRFALDILSQVGARKLFLSTSSLPKYGAAVGFYQKHGFAEEGRLLDFYDDGDHKIIMGRRIRPTARRGYSDRANPTPSPKQLPPVAPSPPPESAPRPKTPQSSDDDVVFEF